MLCRGDGATGERGMWISGVQGAAPMPHMTRVAALLRPFIGLQDGARMRLTSRSTTAPGSHRRGAAWPQRTLPGAVPPPWRPLLPGGQPLPRPLGARKLQGASPAEIATGVLGENYKMSSRLLGRGRMQ